MKFAEKVAALGIQVGSVMKTATEKQFCLVEKIDYDDCRVYTNDGQRYSLNLNLSEYIMFPNSALMRKLNVENLSMPSNGVSNP